MHFCSPIEWLLLQYMPSKCSGDPFDDEVAGCDRPSHYYRALLGMHASMCCSIHNSNGEQTITSIGELRGNLKGE